MDCFDYPLDTKTLYRKKAKLTRELSSQSGLLKKNIAVLGGSTTNEVVDQLRIFLLHYGIDVRFYQSEFGQYWQDAMFGTPELDGFSPDIIYVFTNWRNISRFPDTGDTAAAADALLEAEFDRFRQMWEKLSEKFCCPIIQNNFDRPNYRLLGNRDIWDYRGRSNFISRLNQRFYDYAQRHSDFYINDLEYVSQSYGLEAWSDPLYWHMYKCAMCMDAVPYVAQSAANIIKSIYGKNKKALALDLDNTLWGGVVGDDGVEGIKIGQEESVGQAYAEFQSYCKALKEIGVILTVDSKNELSNALAGLRHPDGVLKPDDFVTIKANWEPKDKNLLETAQELDIGVDSFVFVDDNPAERAIVAAQLSGVATPNTDKVEDFIRYLDRGGYFEVTALSAEDMKKTEMYHAKAEAHRAAAAFSDYGEYLDSLEMTAVIDGFKPIYIQRIAQLTNKSNQFNLTTWRCTEDDIARMQQSEEYICLCGRLIDKFADNGIVSVVIGRLEGSKLHLNLWLMSCRVLKRGMEDAMMNAVVAAAKRHGVTEIVGHYYPTAKNAMVRDFYDKMGFTKSGEDGAGNIEWRQLTGEYVPKTLHMTVDDLVN